MYQKKVISKNVTFTHVRQTCFAYNFLGAYKLCSQTCKKRRQKSKYVLSKCVLDLNFLPINIVAPFCAPKLYKFYKRLPAEPDTFFWNFLNTAEVLQ